MLLFSRVQVFPTVSRRGNTQSTASPLVYFFGMAFLGVFSIPLFFDVINRSPWFSVCFF